MNQNLMICAHRYTNQKVKLLIFRRSLRFLDSKNLVAVGYMKVVERVNIISARHTHTVFKKYSVCYKFFFNFDGPEQIFMSERKHIIFSKRHLEMLL